MFLKNWISNNVFKIKLWNSLHQQHKTVLIVCFLFVLFWFSHIKGVVHCEVDPLGHTASGSFPAVKILQYVMVEDLLHSIDLSWTIVMRL